MSRSPESRPRIRINQGDTVGTVTFADWYKWRHSTLIVLVTDSGGTDREERWTISDGDMPPELLSLCKIFDKAQDEIRATLKRLNGLEQEENG